MANMGSKIITKDEFIRRARLAHGDKYDYTNTVIDKNIVNIKIICPIHGEFEQNKYDHMQGSGCPKCYYESKFNKPDRELNKKFIEKATKVHGDEYDYSKVQYMNSKENVYIIHKKCGQGFWQTPSKHLSGHGCPYCAKNKVKTWDEVLVRAKEVHGDEYGYSKVEYVNMNTKICIIHKKCGHEFWQTPKNHLKGQGCPYCKGEKISKRETKTQKQYIEDARKVHGDKYDYSQTVYKGAKEKVKIICPKHGEFWQVASVHLMGCGCQKCGDERAIKLRIHTTDEFILKAKEIHGEKYNYSKSIYVSAKNLICIICPIHGEFWQIVSRHLSGCGCPKCGGTQKLTTEDFIKRAREVHGDKYDYSKVNYIDAHTKICIICPKHGKFLQIPNDHLTGSGCPSCSHTISKSEQEIYNFINEKYEHEVLHNVRGILSDNKELDIYIPDKKIAIEYDGMLWHSEKYTDDKNYHLNKLEECNKLGIKLINVFENEYLSNKELVLKKISYILGTSHLKEKIMARKCIVKEITKDVAEEFLDKNHIQGFVGSTIYLGLFYNDKLMSVMTFLRKRKGEDKWELTRFASDNDYIVNGGSGKLLHYFIKQNDPSEVSSFADRRWTMDKYSNLYTKLGFKLDNILKPDYHYTNGQKSFIHKFNFRKQILHRKYGLPLCMTEHEMSQKLGYNRIWNCGLFKYVLKLK